METKKRKHDIELEKNDSTPGMSSSPTTLMSLRSGTVSIVEAVAVNLPDVFAAEIVPKLDWDIYPQPGAGEQVVQGCGVERARCVVFDEKLHVAKMELGPCGSVRAANHYVLGGKAHELARGQGLCGVWETGL